MIPTTPLLSAMAALLAADPATLAEVAKVGVKLVKAAFVPGIGLVAGDLTYADFDGSGALAVSSATADVFTDPATGEVIIQLKEPAGGWHWVTTGVTNLPQTIYGAALRNSTGADLWGSVLLDNPVVLSAAGQGIDLAQVRFRVSNGALS